MISAMPAWGDRQIAHFMFRAALFGRRDLAPTQAEALADRLALRDFERDDRRCCFECANRQQTLTCFKRLPMSGAQLVRCVGFEFQTP